MSELKTSYFSFGQDHAHRVNGRTFDCDVLVKITAPDPRQVMFDTFGRKWSMEYSEDSLPDMKYFPNGVVEL